MDTKQLSTCKFCGRTFSSPQGVRAHLKSCKNYQSTKKTNIPSLPKAAREPRQPKVAPPTDKYTYRFDTEIGGYVGSDGVIDFDSEEQRLRYERKQKQKLQKEFIEKLRLQQEETEAIEKQRQDKMKPEKIRHIMQQVKSTAIDYHFEVVPSTAKAKAKLAIEKTLTGLPVLELPYAELVDIAKGIRDEIYGPYIKAKNKEFQDMLENLFKRR